MNESSPAPDALGDHELLARIRAGDEDAATVLYQRYVEQLRALAFRQSSPTLAARVDADDIVQSVFRTFFRRVSEDNYDVPVGDDLWKLLLVITLNKIRRLAGYHKALKRDVRQTVHTSDSPGEWSADRGSDGTDVTLLRLVIDEALSELPESARLIIRKRMEGHEVAELAELSGRSKRSVERVLQQFRQQLKGLLDETG